LFATTFRWWFGGVYYTPSRLQPGFSIKAFRRLGTGLPLIPRLKPLIEKPAPSGLEVRVVCLDTTT